MRVIEAYRKNCVLHLPIFEEEKNWNRGVNQSSD